MRKIISVVAILTAAIATHAQTATNFTATDCNSTSHTLFNELDNGKVVVMVWVMPCISCVAPAKTAYNVAQSFAASHPGRVLYYMVDDYGDHNCSTVSGWATNNNVGNVSNMTIFGNAGETIDMDDYGGDGMPKVVVIGGSNHHVYYNKNNSQANDASGIQSAISDALNATAINDINKKMSFSVTPNPVTERFTVNYRKAVHSVVITTINGKVVKEETFGNGKLNPVIHLDAVANGTYLITVTDVHGLSGVQKLTKE